MGGAQRYRSLQQGDGFCEGSTHPGWFQNSPWPCGSISQSIRCATAIANRTIIDVRVGAGIVRRQRLVHLDPNSSADSFEHDRPQSSSRVQSRPTVRMHIECMPDVVREKFFTDDRRAMRSNEFNPGRIMTCGLPYP
jgi:hypothetical protein